MKILALETSSMTGTVAALEDAQVLGTTNFRPDQRTAQSFAPAIRQQLEKAGWRPQDVDLVAVTNGPGSFTGLRVGVTAAKTFAYATKAQLIAVNTLEVIALQTLAGTSGANDIWAVLNAQRKELFTARFRRRSDDELEWIEETQITGRVEWLEQLRPPAIVSGAGLKPLLANLPAGVTVTDSTLWTPQASTVGRIGYRRFSEGQRDDLWRLVPLYLRPSAAEEKWLQRFDHGATG